MDAASLEPLLGHVVTSEAVRIAFSAVGVDVAREAVLPRDDYRTYIERSPDGLAFVFTDEAWFLGIGERPIGLGPVYFSGIFYYAQDKDGYSQYRFRLPHGLRFSDGSGQAKTVLGDPEWSRRGEDDRLISERWTVGTRKIHLTYGNDGEIELVSYSVPDREL